MFGRDVKSNRRNLIRQADFPLDESGGRMV